MWVWVINQRQVFDFTAKRPNSAQFPMKTREYAPINANYVDKWLLRHEMEIRTMAKRNVVTITLPHNVTVKADKLADRTIRTVKEGDYIPTSLVVRGQVCYFYALAYKVEGDKVLTVFGSEDKTHTVVIPKGGKVDVYRPI